VGERCMYAGLDVRQHSKIHLSFWQIDRRKDCGKLRCTFDS